MPLMEQAQQQAKEHLAETVTREKAQQRRDQRYQRVQHRAMNLILSGDWDRALEVIEALYEYGANRREVIHLLQELKSRLSNMALREYPQRGQRVKELVERVGAGR